MYPLAAILTLIAYFSHKRHIAVTSNPTPYNNDNLNYIGIQILYFSIATHFLMVYLLLNRRWGLIIFMVGTVLVVLKNTMIQRLCSFSREKFGPFCFVNYKPYTEDPKITEMLTHRQRK